MLRHAACAHAHIYFVVELLPFPLCISGYLLKLLDIHQACHLSNCSTIIGASRWATNSPSISTTGARPQAPTHRAVINAILPSLVDSPCLMPRNFSPSATSLSAPLM